MSLHSVLYVNGHPIGAFTIHRQEALDLSDLDAIADEVCTYEVQLHQLARRPEDPDVVYEGKTVKHRYGDGAWELVRTALNSVLDEKPQETTDASI